MLRTTVIYRHTAKGWFDLEYYKSTHAALVIKKLKPLGLLRFEIDTPVEESPKYIVRADLLFDSAQKFDSALSEVGAQLMADTENFTNLEPEIRQSNVVTSI